MTTSYTRPERLCSIHDRLTLLGFDERCWTLRDFHRYNCDLRWPTAWLVHVLFELVRQWVVDCNERSEWAFSLDDLPLRWCPVLCVCLTHEAARQDGNHKWDDRELWKSHGVFLWCVGFRNTYVARVSLVASLPDQACLAVVGKVVVLPAKVQVHPVLDYLKYASRFQKVQ